MVNDLTNEKKVYAAHEHYVRNKKYETKRKKNTRHKPTRAEAEHTKIKQRQKKKLQVGGI